MEKEITWLSHGGPGSGRYPKGSGKKNLSLHGLNKLSKRAARIDHKVNKKENKYNKLVDKYQKAKNKGNINRSQKFESKAWKTMGKLLSGDLYTKQKEAQQKVLNGRKIVEKHLNTSLRIVKGKIVTSVVPYLLPGPILGVHINTIPYAKFKKVKNK